MSEEKFEFIKVKKLEFLKKVSYILTQSLIVDKGDRKSVRAEVS